MTSKPPTFESLPRDLHFCILAFLDWPSLTSLRLTCHTFAWLISKDRLQIQHALCAAHVFAEEEKMRRHLDAVAWEDLEQYFSGCQFSNYAPHHDPDLAALDRKRSCSSSLLPCYVCLRWLPSATSDDRFASASHFSRTRSTLEFDLGGKRARERNCISCGLKKGMYLRGTFVKHNVVCVNCGNLGAPMPDRLHFRSLPKTIWWKGVYCEPCFHDPAVGKVDAAEYFHELRWARYENGLKRGKEYRLENGRKLRDALGVTIAPEEAVAHREWEERALSKPTTGRNRHGYPPSKERGPNAGYCPTMGEMRFCFCGGWEPPYRVRNQSEPKGGTHNPLN